MDEGLFEIGPFRLNTESRSLFRDGEPVSVSPKALEILCLLVKNRPNEVNKDELLAAVWPGTFVEEANLYHYVHELRQIFEEAENGDRWIKTVSGRGYRFVGPAQKASLALGTAPVLVSERSGPPLGKGPAIHDKDIGKTQKGYGRAVPAWRRAPAILAVGLVTAAFTYVVERYLHPPRPRVVSTNRLTDDGREKSVYHFFSDGSVLYFYENVDGGQTMWIPANGGEITPMPAVAGFNVSDISRDGLQFVATKPGNPGEASLIWIVPARAGPPRNLGLRGESPAWSPDETQIVYSNGHGLYVARSDGGDPRLLATMPDLPRDPHWSPDGNVIRFDVYDSKAHTTSLWQVQSNGAARQEVSLDLKKNLFGYSGRWTPDGRDYVFHHRQPENDSYELWARREKCGLFFWECGKVFPLTQKPTSFFNHLSSADGKKVFAIGAAEQTRLERYDIGSGSFFTFLEGTPATQVDFSRDGRWVAYVNLNGRALWRSRVDGSEKLQLTFPPAEASQPHWSPDGKQIAFMKSDGGHSKVCLIPADGGAVQELIPGDEQEGAPTWSKDGKELVFGEPLRGVKPLAMSIHLFDLETHKLSTLPDSHGLWTARWAPDGRYIAALVVGEGEVKPDYSPALRLYDLVTRKWTTLAEINYIEEPTWSQDSKYIYFHTTGQPDFGLYRVGIANRKLDLLVRVPKSWLAADNWTGVALDGSPLVIHGVSIREIYALEVEWP